MKVTIISPERTLFSGEATGVVVPGVKGRFEVLENHAPLISILSAGTVVCRSAEVQEIRITGGFLEVARNEVSVCVETEE